MKRLKKITITTALLFIAITAFSVKLQAQVSLYKQVVACQASTTIRIAANGACASSSIEVTGNTAPGATVTATATEIIYTPNGFSGRDVVSLIHTCDGKTTQYVLNLTVAKCPDNIIINECEGSRIEPGEFSIKELSRSDEKVNILTNPLSGDIDDDGEIEILVINHTGSPNSSSFDAIVVYGFDKVTNSLYLKYKIYIPYNVIFPGSPLAIAKVDGNRYASIFYTSIVDRKLYKFDLTGSVPNAFSSSLPSISSWSVSWATTYTYNAMYDLVAPVIADIMGSGRTQVVMLDKVIDTKTGNIIADGAMIPWSGRSAYSFGAFGHIVNSSHESCPVIIDIDGDGIQELIGGDCVYDIRIVNFDQAAAGNTFTLKRRASNVGHPEIGDGGTAVADIDNCGQVEVIIAGPVANGYTVNVPGMLYIYNPRTGEVMHSNVIADLPRDTPYGQYGPSRPFVGDFDNDGFPEIALTSVEVLRSYKYNKVSKLLQMVWSLLTTDTSGSTTLTVFDFVQDGKNRLVYRDERQLRMIDASKNPPVVNAFFDSVESPTINEFPIIVDVNGDGATEIVVTGANYSRSTAGMSWTFAGELRVYASADHPWAPARSVWNQASYYATNVNDDLTIPRFPVNPATVFPGEGGNGELRPFNGFLKQQTTLKESGEYAWVTPYVTWAHPLPAANTGNSTITGCIKNNGAAALIAPVYVTFYKNKATVPNIVALDSINKTLLPYEEYCFSFPIKNLCSIAPFDDLLISMNDKNGIYPYQAQCELDGRKSLGASMEVAAATDVVIEDADICAGSCVTITPSSTIDNPVFHWYAEKTATTPFYTGSSLELTELESSVTYFIAVSGDNHCKNVIEERKKVTVTAFSPVECAFLPVELVAFAAAATPEGVLLTWETASERNNDFFTLWRSRSGEQFGEVAQINGAGNTTQAQHYAFNDKKPYPGLSYYRLSQTDYNGETTFHNIVPVNYNAAFENFTVTSFSNNGITTLSCTFADTQYPNQVSIHTVGGNVEYSQTIPAGIAQHTIEIPLKAGVYIVINSCGETATAVKVVAP